MKKIKCIVPAFCLVILLCYSAFAANPAVLPSSKGASNCDHKKSVDFIKAVFPSDDKWEKFFPVAFKHPSCSGKKILSKNNLIDAAKAYPSFCGSSSTEMNLQELAALLANVSLETNGAAPDKLDGGLCFASEVGCDKAGACCNYCKVDPPYNKAPKCDCGYYGRGALQITNPYNYYEASIELFGEAEKDLKKNQFYNDPEKILTGPNAWKASLAFWVKHVGGFDAASQTTIKKQTTAHDAITSDGIDFGKTVEVINGNFECANPNPDFRKKTAGRIGYYKQYIAAFSSACGLSVSPTANVDCASSTPTPPPDDKTSRCGVDWNTANKICGKLCKTSDQCPPGEGCYASLDLVPCQ